MESYSWPQVQEIVRHAETLIDVCRQFKCKTDIPIWQLKPGELTVYYLQLNELRRVVPVIEWKSCELPEGFHRPKTGDRQIAADHRGV